MNIETAIERFIINEITMGAQTKIEPNQSLLSSGILDSLALLRLIGFIEEQFGVTVEDDEVVPDNFETVNNLSTFLNRKMSSK